MANQTYSSAIGQATACAIAAETTIFAFTLTWEAATVPSTPTAVISIGYSASFVLAPSVVTMMACLYETVPQHLKIFGSLALLFSILYATLCMVPYFLQLSIVSTNPSNLSSDVLDAFAFKPGSPAFAIDMLGYACLCLSTLSAGFALPNGALRVLCWVHGALVLPTLLSPILSGIFLSSSGEADATGDYVLLGWCAIFFPIALLFRRYFKTQRDTAVKATNGQVGETTCLIPS